MRLSNLEIVQVAQHVYYICNQRKQRHLVAKIVINWWLIEKIIQVTNLIPWVHCASGNVLDTDISLNALKLIIIKKVASPIQNRRFDHRKKVV